MSELENEVEVVKVLEMILERSVFAECEARWALDHLKRGSRFGWDFAAAAGRLALADLWADFGEDEAGKIRWMVGRMERMVGEGEERA